jgi:NAD(P)H dehydrogenase (quinone)
MRIELPSPKVLDTWKLIVIHMEVKQHPKLVEVEHDHDGPELPMNPYLTAVTAASGKTGQAVVRELRASDLPVRALVHRRDARSEALLQLGAEVVEADVFDADQMASALRGVQRAYYCPPIDPQAGQMLDAFMHAAESNQLEAVVAMTQWLASPNHPTRMTRDMWAVEQRLPTLKSAAVTILNPGFFADNYLRVTIGMAAQLGLYPNFVGDSRNAPPSNDDMARVAAGVLNDPARFAGRRLRVTGPELIGATEIVAALSKVLGRKVRAIAAPDWLLNKVAAYRDEPRYAMAVFRHYLIDHRQGAFAYGAPTQVVQEVTGRPAESFETTTRSYLRMKEAQRTTNAFRQVLTEFMVAPMWRGYNHAAYERQFGLADLAHSLYAMQDDVWRADHARPDGLATMETRFGGTTRPMQRSA